MAVNEQNSNSSQERVQWSIDEVFRLIECVKRNRALYNSSDKNYFRRPYIDRIWRNIDVDLGKMPGASASRWRNLRVGFSREYNLLKKKKTKRTWTFFDKLMFLKPYLRKKLQPIPQLESQIQEALQQIGSITRGNFKNYVANIEACETTTTANEHPENSETEITIDEKTTWAYEPLTKEEDSSVGNEELVGETHEPFDDCVEEINDSSSNDYEMPRNSNIDHSKSLAYRPMEQWTRFSSRPNDSSAQQLLPSVDHESHSVVKQSHAQIVGLLTQNTSTEPSSSPSLAAARCECKTNADAMFLMSLMPDIQLLTGRDKGKFKIEVQRLIQSLLYPDEK